MQRGPAPRGADDDEDDEKRVPLLGTVEDGAGGERGAEDDLSKGCSPFAAAANLTMSVLGAGQLTLPYALQRMGLACGLATLAALGGLGAYVLTCLASCAEPKGGEGGRGKRCYGTLVGASLHPHARTAADALLAVYAFGGSVSFNIIIAAQLSTLAHHAGLSGLWANRDALLALVTFALVLPLSFLRDLAWLKHTSVLGSFAAVLITGVVCAEADWRASFSAGPCGGAKARLWPESAQDAFAAVPLFAFALNSAWAFVPVRASMAHPTRERVAALVWGSKALILANYLLIALVGYLSLCGEGIEDNVLDNLPPRPAVTLARGALALQLSLALPLRNNVARGVLLRSARAAPGAHYGCTAALVVGAFGFALATHSLHTAIGLTSAVCASALIYILPGLARWSDLRGAGYGGASEEGKGNVLGMAAALATAAFGAALLVTGTAANVIEIVRGGSVGGGR